MAFGTAPNGDISSAYTSPSFGSPDGSITPADRLSNPFPNGIIAAPGRSPNLRRLFYGQGGSAPLYSDPRA